MLLPIEWLREYVEIQDDTKTLADNLTLSGSHVEAIISRDKNIDKVVVGKIEELYKHPNADKLYISKVDIGKEKLQIVTGADNLKIGDCVPVALVGGQLPNGLYIEETDFRGENSYGMLCSLKELGYPDSVIPREAGDGIFVIKGEWELGEDIKDVLGLYNEIIELEITPNRPDCQSIIGMARETAASLDKKVKYPEIKVENEIDNIENYLDTIEIDHDLCNRYYAKVVKNVKIGESPLWLQKRLMEAGMRPINNIVDITNYVMLEFGQPLHAFDYDKLADRKIIVRRAKEGESIKTIDESERKLMPSNLVVADSNRPIAIAGVMGGFDTEIDEKTSTVLLESAIFNDKSVRLTAKDLNLRTEASSRFEKGIDSNLCPRAAMRVCQLIEEINAGEIVEGYIDVYRDLTKEKEILLKPSHVNRLLGIDISVDEMIAYLERLELEAQVDGENIRVIAPSFRLDLLEEVDLIEEIGRLYGFHNIRPKALVGELTRGGKSYGRRIEDRTDFILQGLDLNQVMTYSFISPRVYDKLNIDENSNLREYIRILNPLGEDYSIMRTSLIANMLNLLGKNYNHGVEECLFYEIGNIFIPRELPVEQLPIEEKTLTLGMYGDVNFYDLKEAVETLLERLGISGLEFLPKTDNPIFHPYRTAEVRYGEDSLGIIGEIHMDIMENFEIERKSYLGELNFDKIIKLANLEKSYRPLPRYPSITRDIALVVDKDIMVGQLEKIIWENGEGLIEEVKLFDIYEGKQIEENKKSVAFEIRYRSYETTLKDDQVNKLQENIIKELEKSFGAQLRT